jgi:hypothetical protein
VAQLSSCPCAAQLCSRFWMAQRFTAAITTKYSIPALAAEGRSIPSRNHRDWLALGSRQLATVSFVNTP